MINWNLLSWESIFHPFYILSATIISCLALRANGAGAIRLGISQIFNKHNWLNSSVFIDLILSLLNLVLLQALVDRVEHRSFLLFQNHQMSWMNWHLPKMAESAAVTMATMVAIDGASYFVHRWMHNNGWLWKIHSWHHSAEFLSPLTTYRQHPLEPFLLNAARGAAAGFAVVTFRFFFPDQAPVVTVYGLGFGFFIYMFTVNLHHWMIPVHYPPILRKFLISPHCHHLHHSSDPADFNANFGVVFSFWDRWFGTYRDRTVGLGELKFGLESTNRQIFQKPRLS